MTTGVKIADEVQTEFNEFKLRSTKRYLIFKLSSDKKTIEIEKSADRSATYEDFVRDLPKDDCRYATFCFEYETPKDGKRAKIIFFNWAPENSPTKSKMIYAGTKGVVKDSLVGVNFEIQATDLSEIDQKEVHEKCLSFK